MESLADRFRRARKAKKLSQAALAKALGCGQTTIASIENSRNKRTSSILPGAAALLGVDLVWLSSGRGDMYAGSRDESHATQEERTRLSLSADYSSSDDLSLSAEYVASASAARDAAIDAAVTEVLKLYGMTLDDYLLNKGQDGILQNSSQPGIVARTRIRLPPVANADGDDGVSKKKETGR